MKPFSQEKEAVVMRPLAEVILRPPFIRVLLSQSHRVLSFAPICGGMVEAREVLWLGLKDGDLKPPASPNDFFQDEVKKAGFSKDAVGLMTSADIRKYSVASKKFGNSEVMAVATVGLGNRRRIGDSPGPEGVIKKGYGTINVLIVVSISLSEEAMIEGLSLMSEARTLAMLESGLRSPLSGGLATGTGTDCLALACPLKRGGGLKYAGKHTVMGHLVGAAVYGAVSQGISKWQKEWLHSPPDKEFGGL